MVEEEEEEEEEEEVAETTREEAVVVVVEEDGAPLPSEENRTLRFSGKTRVSWTMPLLSWK